ncbi:MAG TPA: HAMP domain-containing sensor histidine kinase [Candidatus Limnocylindria bacterium]|nr:HAMP domain-containing sensor histidine kinase [Candidatus Limnocylindria bacterium]
MTVDAEPRGQPLSLRLALALSAAMLAVLLLTGVAVNRLVSGSLEQELSAGERDRITLLADTIAAVDLDAPRARLATEAVLRRVANTMHGRAELIMGDGSTRIAVGRLPAGVTTERIEEPIPDSDATLVIEVPRPDRAFLRVFNLTLIVAGVLAIAALIGVALFLSARVTRPLRGVAAAARQLGRGDLSARASGGPDRESAELAGAFNAMAERVQRSEMLRRRAASDMAHDLATPATVLESQLQAMLDGVVPADREQLERARSAAGALSGVVAQLGDLVDAESAALQRRPKSQELGALLADIERAMEPLFRERDVALAVGAAEAGTAVQVDSTQVGRAIRNVLVNAAQHSPAGATVRVDVEAQPGEAILRITDAGPGISPADLPHVFERFYRADRARGGGESRAGAGIGLTIARELLTANGGSIDLEASGPGGSTFRISLPRARLPGG